MDMHFQHLDAALIIAHMVAPGFANSLGIPVHRVDHALINLRDTFAVPTGHSQRSLIASGMSALICEHLRLFFLQFLILLVFIMQHLNLETGYNATAPAVKMYMTNREADAAAYIIQAADLYGEQSSVVVSGEDEDEDEDEEEDEEDNGWTAISRCKKSSKTTALPPGYKAHREYVKSMVTGALKVRTSWKHH